MAKIRGKIIRILNSRTVIISLGRNDGITDQNVFSILGEPEAVVDPDTGEELGHVLVVKDKVQASAVYDRFTIATTRITGESSWIASLFGRTAVQEEYSLRVVKDEVKPWRSESELPVRLGDLVETQVRNSNEKTAEPEVPFAAPPKELPASTIEVIVCPKCGTENGQDAKYCVSCGQPLRPQADVS